MTWRAVADDARSSARITAPVLGRRSSATWQAGSGKPDASEVLREVLDAWLKTRRK
jgi:hypothetical protein